MIRDFFDSASETEYSADVLIIGAGAVGLLTAMSLINAGRKVLVLEAGGELIEIESQRFLQEAISSGLVFEGLSAGRFSGLGGTTTAWGGQLVVMDPIVFESRPWVSDVRWPFERKMLDKYYQKAAKLLDARDPLVSDEAIWESLNVPVPKLGQDVDLFFSQWLKQPNFGALFYPVLSADRGADVLTHARAVAFDAGPDGEIRRVIINSRNGRTGTVRAQSIILAAGTIETVRTLLTPLVSGEYAGWSRNPWLGKCFIDHVECNAGRVIPLDRHRFHDVFDNALVGGVKYAPRLKISADAQKRHNLVGCGGHLIFDSLLQEHLQNFKAFSKTLFTGRKPKNVGRAAVHLLKLSKIMYPLIKRYLKSNRILSVSDGGIRLRLSCEQIPIVESEISLSKTKDKSGISLVNVNWRIDGREIRSMAFLAKKIRDEFHRNNLASVELDEKLIIESLDVLNGVDDAFHQMGGTRIGACCDEGVVDENCCVYGSKNLFVAGASVFPVSGFENPTFTALALAVRLGEFVADQK